MSNKMHNQWIGLVMALLSFSACGTVHTSEREPMQRMESQFAQYVMDLNEKQYDLLQRNNDFALQLFQRTAGMQSVVLSPLSVTYLMSMLAEGAEGETDRQILRTLGWEGVTHTELQTLCHELLTKTPLIDPSTTLSVANCLAVHQSLSLQKEYVKQLKSQYMAEVKRLDFSKPAAIEAINGWCYDRTQGMIPKIIDKLSPEDRLVIMNAIYFNGTWKEKFRTEETREEQFFGYTRDLVRLPMMHQEEEFYYTANTNYTAVSLPYGQGNYAMTILLPSEQNSLKTLASSLTAGELHALSRNMERCLVDLKLPRFTIENEITLNDMLMALGATNLFDSRKADFRGMSKEPLFLSKMLQKAKIEVSEEGTKAAAVTAGIMTMSALRPEPRKVEFHANRPFLYLITERSSGAIYFIGQFTGK